MVDPRPMGEDGYYTTVEHAAKSLGIRLHAMIMSKQPEVITYQPPSRIVRKLGKPRSWFQRLKLRRGFGWLRWINEVQLVVTYERYQPPAVEITGEVLYPGAAVKRHKHMGPPVMSFAGDTFVQAMPPGGEVQVEYAPSSRRPVWVDRRTKESLERLAESLSGSQDEVLMYAFDRMARDRGVGMVIGRGRSW
jgi:hypothetical protein